MNEVTNNSGNKEIIYFTKLHWIIFFGSFLCLTIALAVYCYVEPLREISYILACFALVWIGITWVTYYFSSITIKKNQVILRTGIIVRQTVDIPFSKIETIDIRQSIIGSILRYGTLMITGTGGTRHQINYLLRPLTCRRYIEQLMNKDNLGELKT